MHWGTSVWSVVITTKTGCQKTQFPLLSEMHCSISEGSDLSQGKANCYYLPPEIRHILLQVTQYVSNGRRKSDNTVSINSSKSYESSVSTKYTIDSVPYPRQQSLGQVKQTVWPQHSKNDCLSFYPKFINLLRWRANTNSSGSTGTV